MGLFNGGGGMENSKLFMDVSGQYEVIWFRVGAFVSELWIEKWRG